MHDCFAFSVLLLSLVTCSEDAIPDYESQLQPSKALCQKHVNLSDADYAKVPCEERPADIQYESPVQGGPVEVSVAEARRRCGRADSMD